MHKRFENLESSDVYVVCGVLREYKVANPRMCPQQKTIVDE